MSIEELISFTIKTGVILAVLALIEVIIQILLHKCDCEDMDNNK